MPESVWKCEQELNKYNWLKHQLFTIVWGYLYNFSLLAHSGKTLKGNWASEKLAMVCIYWCNEATFIKQTVYTRITFLKLSDK